MSLQILFTAFALIALMGSAASAYVAWSNANELRKVMVGAVELAQDVDALKRSHRKLAGTFYREKRGEFGGPNYVEPGVDTDLTPRDQLRRQHAGRMIPPGVNRGA